jgi:hypothetical protein
MIFRFRSSTAKRAFILTTGALGTISGAGMAIFGRGQDRGIGLVAVAFFGGGLVALLLDRPTRLTSPVVLRSVQFRGAVGTGFLFPTPRRKILLALLGALIFVTVGVAFIALAPRFGPSGLIDAVGAVTILFSGFVGATGAIALLRGHAGLILLPQGVGQVGGPFSYIVPWDAVGSVRVRLAGLGLSPSLCLSMVDPRAIQAGRITLWSLPFNRWINGADIALQTALVGVPLERLIPILERYRNAPEVRGEIGTSAGLATVNRLL